MSEENINTNTDQNNIAPQTQVKAPAQAPRGFSSRTGSQVGGGRGQFGSSDRGGARGPRRGGGKRGPDGKPFERQKPEFDQKMLDVRRVTRVVAGGRRFSFSVTLAAGDKKGAVGIGLGKAGDMSLAINKALRNAKKNMVRLNLTKTMSIPHEVSAKFSSCFVVLMPNKGRGLVAGAAIRDIANLAGLKDITGKVHSASKNKLNNAKAVMKALAQVSTKYTKQSVVFNAEPKVENLNNTEKTTEDLNK